MKYLVILVGLCVCIHSSSCNSTVDSNKTASPNVTLTKYDSAAVVTAHPIATQVGYDVLKSGGNAFDAAIAVQFALTVCYPRAGNIGGGGFMVYRDVNGKSGSLDFREKAPLSATRDMYLDENDYAIKNLSKIDIKSVGVPGSVAGMWDIHRKFGSVKWKELLSYSLDLTKHGCQQTTGNIASLDKSRKLLIETNGGFHIYAPETPLKAGDMIVNMDLHQTLLLISENGKDGFYGGEVADKIVTESNNRGGLITHQDLEKYEAIWRDPLEGQIGNYNIISMGPPSSGGLAILQLMEASERLNIGKYNHNSPEAIHLMTEAKKRVYADRSTWLGDPDFFDVPTDSLLDDDYLTKRFASINLDYITPSNKVKTGKVDDIESHETTHFSILDKYGNAVSITTTLNSYFGSKILVEGGGFFLNNEMDDFSVKPGVPNQFGLIGGKANAIEPEKRMLSSMSPTIVEKDGKLWMILGTPGGSTIITNVYQTIQNVMYYDMSMQEAVNSGKVHSQWLPEKIHYEKGKLDLKTIEKLEDKGYTLDHWDRIGLMEAILIHPDGKIEAAADTTRGEDKTLGW